MKTYVAGFYFKAGLSDMGAVLLIRKQKPAWMKGKLNGIGGKAEPGETPKVAMMREFKEETDLLVTSDRWTHFLTLVGKDSEGEDFQVYFFRADRNWDDLDPRTVTDEHVSYVPVESVHELPNWFLPNLRWIIPMANESQKHDWPFIVYERANTAAREEARRV